MKKADKFVCTTCGTGMFGKYAKKTHFCKNGSNIILDRVECRGHRGIDEALKQQRAA